MPPMQHKTSVLYPHSLSYLFLLGKCHYKKNIGLRYPLSEIIYGVFFILVWQKLSPFFLNLWQLVF